MKTGNLIAIATTKWTLINILDTSITRITDDIIGCYNLEQRRVFGDADFTKLKTPDSSVETFSFPVLRKDIDVNEHMHNLYYLSYAYEALPQNVFDNFVSNEFEIMYKSGAKLNDTVTCYYAQENDAHFVTMKTEDKNTLNAIIKLW